MTEFQLKKSNSFGSPAGQRPSAIGLAVLLLGFLVALVFFSALAIIVWGQSRHVGFSESQSALVVTIFGILTLCGIGGSMHFRSLTSRKEEKSKKANADSGVRYAPELARQITMQQIRGLSTVVRNEPVGPVEDIEEIFRDSGPRSGSGSHEVIDDDEAGTENGSLEGDDESGTSQKGGEKHHSADGTAEDNVVRKNKKSEASAKDLGSENDSTGDVGGSGEGASEGSATAGAEEEEDQLAKIEQEVDRNIEEISRVLARSTDLIRNFDLFLFEHIRSTKAGEINAFFNAKRIVTALEDLEKKLKKFRKKGGEESLKKAQELLREKMEIPVDAVNSLVGSVPLPAKVPKEWEPTLDELFNVIRENIVRAVRGRSEKLNLIINDCTQRIVALGTIVEAHPDIDLCTHGGTDVLVNAKIVVAALHQFSEDTSSLLADPSIDDLNTIDKMFGERMDIPVRIYDESREEVYSPEIKPLQWTPIIEGLLQRLETQIDEKIHGNEMKSESTDSEETDSEKTGSEKIE